MKLFSLLGSEGAGRGFFLVTPANVQVQDLDLVKWDTPYNTDIKPLWLIRLIESCQAGYKPS